jgi:tetraacyldisaccharide 4'-kinase
VISDDGLQHYALSRSLEIAVIDTERGLGNGYCLPAGPLREPLSRLETVDLIVYNDRDNENCIRENHMHYQLDDCYQAQNTKHHQPLSAFKGQTVHAVAGIGYPQSFFRQLTALGITVIPHAYADHYIYQAQDIYFNDDLPIILSEKDWVKCRSFLRPTHWVLAIQAILSAEFYKNLDQRLKERTFNG